MSDTDVTANITCDQAQENSLALLAGELSDSEERQLHKHLASCSRCRAEVRRDRMVIQMLHACPAPLAGPNFDDLLFARLDQPEDVVPITTRIPSSMKHKDKIGSSPRSKPSPGDFSKHPKE